VLLGLSPARFCGLPIAQITIGGGILSDEPDHERVRALIVELDKVQQESERIRERIAKIRRRRPEFSDEREASDLDVDPRDPSKKHRR
jgi:hypothetical protein